MTVQTPGELADPADEVVWPAQAWGASVNRLALRLPKEKTLRTLSNRNVELELI